MLSKMEYQIDKTLQNKETNMLKRIQFCTHKKNGCENSPF